MAPPGIVHVSHVGDRDELSSGGILASSQDAPAVLAAQWCGAGEQLK